MVSESELVTRLREILRSSDLDKETPASIRRQLQEDFGIDFTDRKSFIRDQIDIFLQNQGQEEENEGEQDEANVKSEAEEEEPDEQEKEGDEKGEEDANEANGRASKKSGKKRGGGFQKLCSLSPQLQRFVGVPELPRTEVVKKIWAYIRENNLQDPKNRRNIICDESLHAIFRVKTINMFQMNKALSRHIWPLTEMNGDVSNPKEDENESEEEIKEDEEERAEQGNEENEEDDKEENDVEQKTEKRIKRKKSANTGDRKRGGFTKLCSLSPKLQAFTGASELARTEVVKMLWSYIKENNLQDPKNKRKIICDESLRELFNVDSIDMFQMNKALSKHIWPLEEEGAANDPPEKGKRKNETEEDSEEPKQTDKRLKKGSSGLLSPLLLSDALVKFLGTGENELSPEEAEKRIWDYVKQSKLQAPSNEQRIICDDKLKELFNVDSIDGSSVAKLLASHFINTER